MNNKLVLHASAQSSAAAQLLVTASAELSESSLFLQYEIDAPQAVNIVWPKSNSASGVLSESQRKDELWKTTCLEAFLLFEDKSYIELNFSPSGDWNAYRFDSYREGMKRETRIGQMTEFKSSPYQLSVKVELAQAVNASQNFRLGLTCVIETDGGERSYWSLKHVGEKPDFHDSRGHILEMRI